MTSRRRHPNINNSGDLLVTEGSRSSVSTSPLLVTNAEEIIINNTTGQQQQNQEDNDEQDPLLHSDNNNDNGGDRDSAAITTRSSSRVRRTLSLLASPVTDQEGKPLAIVMGLVGMALGGSILGMLLPKDESLPSAAGYRTISSCIGYTYFLCWSTSFYPQVLTNYRRKNTTGLSVDFCLLNVLGFACYTVYNVAMFYSPEIQRLYRQRYGTEAVIPVQSNDVAFAVHALVLATTTLSQILYYNGLGGGCGCTRGCFRRPSSSSSPSSTMIATQQQQQQQAPSRAILFVIVGIFVVALGFPLLIVLGGSHGKFLGFVTVPSLNWLDYVFVLSLVKIMVTLIKYVPQVILNFKRQSTAGWSIWNIILDMSGGTLSDLQLVLDCAALGDFTGITGNVAKLLLGSVSILFDAVFMLQHYVLYPSVPGASSHGTMDDANDEEIPLDQDEEEEAIQHV